MSEFQIGDAVQLTAEAREYHGDLDQGQVVCVEHDTWLRVRWPGGRVTMFNPECVEHVPPRSGGWYEKWAEAIAERDAARAELETTRRQWREVCAARDYLSVQNDAARAELHEARVERDRAIVERNEASDDAAFWRAGYGRLYDEARAMMEKMGATP